MIRSESPECDILLFLKGRSRQCVVSEEGWIPSQRRFLFTGRSGDTRTWQPAWRRASYWFVGRHPFFQRLLCCKVMTRASLLRLCLVFFTYSCHIVIPRYPSIPSKSLDRNSFLLAILSCGCIGAYPGHGHLIPFHGNWSLVYFVWSVLA